jgi:hypothetical protein
MHALHASLPTQLKNDFSPGVRSDRNFKTGHRHDAPLPTCRVFLDEKSTNFHNFFLFPTAGTHTPFQYGCAKKHPLAKNRLLIAQIVTRHFIFCYLCDFHMDTHDDSSKIQLHIFARQFPSMKRACRNNYNRKTYKITL